MELKRAFHRLARHDKRQHIAAKVADGEWHNTKSYRKRKSVGAVCIRNAAGALCDASQRAECFREKLDGEVWNRGDASEAIRAQIPEFLTSLRLGDRNIGPDFYARPFSEYIVRELVRVLPHGRSCRPTGVAYEVWQLLADLAGISPRQNKARVARRAPPVPGARFPYPFNDPHPDVLPGPWHPPKVHKKTTAPWPLPAISPGLVWLTKLINRFMREGRSSALGRKQVIVPGYKDKGDPASTEWYRYFALSGPLAKIVRRGLAERLYHHIEPFLTDNQFGFIKRRGCDDAFFYLGRAIEQFLWSKDLYLYITSLDFYKAYDRVYVEAVSACLDSWGIDGNFRSLLESFLRPTCHVAGIKGFPDSREFQQLRGLPTGAPEAPVLFLALSLWWEAGRAGWDKLNPPTVRETLIAQVEKSYLPLRNITYADDTNLLSLSELTATREVSLIHSVGPRLGLVLNLLKCVVRRILADSAYFRGTATRSTLHRVLSEPCVWAGDSKLPTDLPLKILGGGIHLKSGAMAEIMSRGNETRAALRNLNEMIRGASMSRKWMLRHVEAISGGKLAFGLLAFSLNQKEENKIDSIQMACLRVWSREPLLFLAAPNERRSNASLRQVYELPKWSHRVRLSRFRYACKLFRMESHDPRRRMIINEDGSCATLDIATLPGGGHRQKWIDQVRGEAGWSSDGLSYLGSWSAFVRDAFCSRAGRLASRREIRAGLSPEHWHSPQFYQHHPPLPVSPPPPPPECCFPPPPAKYHPRFCSTEVFHNSFNLCRRLREGGAPENIFATMRVARLAIENETFSLAERKRRFSVRPERFECNRGVGTVAPLLCNVCVCG